MKTSTSFRAFFLSVVLFCLSSDPRLNFAIASKSDPDWCQTTEEYFRKYGALKSGTESCYTFGDCDIPAIRDSWIPSGLDPLRVVKLAFHVFRNDNALNPAADSATVASVVDELNADYLPSRIQFVYSLRFINSTEFRSLSNVEVVPMKDLYATNPESGLNVFVTNVEASYSVGTFPWDPDALTSQGGIVMTTRHFYAGSSVLSHEVGHCLGLWHTHHGVSEMGECSICYERADGVDADVTGDYCGDTEATPVNNYCVELTTSDPCSGVPWAPTDLDNFMSYTGDFCWTTFTAQQDGRMRCWLHDVLSGWLCEFGADPDGDSVGGYCDNCPNLANTNQSDVDGDLVGDSCDNCPFVANVDQRDENQDGIGDLCDGNVHIYSAILPPAYLGLPYYFSLEAAGGVLPYQWSLLSGQTPPGLSFAGGANGVVDGTPTTEGVFPFTVQLLDSDNPANADTANVSIEVTFFCGDFNGDLRANIVDLVHLIAYIFNNGAPPNPLQSGDVNCNGFISVADVVYFIQYIFIGGPDPCAGC